MFGERVGAGLQLQPRAKLFIAYSTETSLILVCFCLILVTMSTILAPMKIQVAYLYLPTPYNLLYMQKTP